MPKIWVNGDGGQLASEIKYLSNSYNGQFFFTNSSTLDISNETAVKAFVEKQNIDTIINCAAYTQVDKAEEQIELAKSVNSIAVKNLAQLSKEQNIKLVHFSTDYVFDGKQSTPYTETDTPNPQTIYGKTKLEGENAIKNIILKSAIIIRTSWVYSSYGHNFVKTILRLAKEKNEINVVSDQIGSPTYAADLAKFVLTVLPRIKNDGVEVFHYANMGRTSWYEFAKKIVDMAQINCHVKPILTKDYPTATIRPAYSLLDTSKIKNTFEIDIPFWEESLRECLKRL